MLASLLGSQQQVSHVQHVHADLANVDSVEKLDTYTTTHEHVESHLDVSPALGWDPADVSPCAACACTQITSSREETC